MRALFGALSILLLVAFTSQTASAQQACPFGVPWCKIGPDGRVTVTPPSPSASGSASGQAQGQGQGQGTLTPPDPWAAQRAQWEAEAKARAAWELHFKLEAEARVRIRAQVSTELHAEWQARWQQTPDPWRGIPSPRGGGGVAVSELSYPGVSIGPISPCGTVWTGTGSPLSFGYCPAIRLRATRLLSVDFGPSITGTNHGSFTYGSINWHPAVLFNLLEGPPTSPGARGYARAGLDLYVPWNGGTKTPDAFVGFHVGFGAEYIKVWPGIGLELRGVFRRGFGNGDDPVAGPMSRWHAGLELRINFLLVSN